MPGAGSPLLPCRRPPLLPPPARFNECTAEWPASSRRRGWRLGVADELPAAGLNAGADGDELGADLAASTPPHRHGLGRRLPPPSAGMSSAGVPLLPPPAPAGLFPTSATSSGPSSAGSPLLPSPAAARIWAHPPSANDEPLVVVVFLASSPLPAGDKVLEAAARSGARERRRGRRRGAGGREVTASRRHALHNAGSSRFSATRGLALARNRASLCGGEELWWGARPSATHAQIRAGDVR
ncbi:uncharacterized protein [Oryza sativa Japonica Group]|uniref:Os08g0408300 protein n=3 Tax=Oryza TaxID=4527 RepID=B9G0U5_ORYSJ|nr:uncharacterized protein LOC4345540 [Oryza sativa Japonica Group]EEE68662.1 hypothetical protein OsJ_27263 [Oryza sativa Japonica Group]BAC98616.1 unknown protein [Oryza sativa Japonica Group]BAC99616.1 unknown protein [Oryza sativa Japonica Group]BAF23692.1 Os08g0408300 [Oryza sativa Japonica Group]BAG87217.1 unnamed protein product [Oryza sativa Japonica Group]|eukprot:NP_001061778.1 Os08g0408300 [Oryza sativa Japonica Group]